MSSDPFVDEIREIRERLAAQFGFDVRAIAEDVRRRDAAGDREIVRLPPRRPVCESETSRYTSVTPDIQREAMALLVEIWGLSPDVRLGQLFAHLGFLGEAHVGRGLGYIEDNELIAIMYGHRAELVVRLKAASNQTATPAGAATSVSGSPVPPEAHAATDLRHQAAD